MLDYTKVFDEAHCGFLFTGLDWEFKKANGTLLGWLGLTQEEFLSHKTLRDYITIGSRIYLDTTIDPLLRMQGSVIEVMIELKTRTGSALPVLLSCVIERDEKGNPLYLRSTLSNMSERRRYEKELVEAKNRATRSAHRMEFLAKSFDIIRNGQDPYLSLEKLCQLATENFADACSIDFFSSQFKVAHHRVEGEKVSPSISAKDLRSPVLISDVMTSGLSLAREYEDMLPQSILFIPLEIDQRIVAVMTFFMTHLGRRFDKEDERIGSQVARTLGMAIESFQLTLKDEENKRKLLASSRLQSLGEMAEGVAHEINNPLVMINMSAMIMIEDLESGELDKDVFRRKLGEMIGNTERIRSVTKGLFDFSRNSENDPPITFSLSSLIRQTAALFHERFKLAGVKLISNLPPHDIAISGRPPQISQVLMILLSNAFDAVQELSEKWVTVELSEGNGIHLRVTDSGTGIPPEIAEKLMHPFFSTKPEGKGMGLGLSIAHGILSRHKGKLTYDSESGNTSFVVQLPAI